MGKKNYCLSLIIFFATNFCFAADNVRLNDDHIVAFSLFDDAQLGVQFKAISRQLSKPRITPKEQDIAIQKLEILARAGYKKAFNWLTNARNIEAVKTFQGQAQFIKEFLAITTSDKAKTLAKNYIKARQDNDDFWTSLMNQIRADPRRKIILSVWGRFDGVKPIDQSTWNR